MKFLPRYKLTGLHTIPSKMNEAERAIVKQLDDGSLYGTPSIVEKLMSFQDPDVTRLVVSYDDKGVANGYIPIGFYHSNDRIVSSYLSGLPNSPPISATYTPGAEHALSKILDESIPYVADDIVANFRLINTQAVSQTPTASAYCLSLKRYWSLLSASRRKDFRRKLKAAKHYTIEAGSMDDIQTARPWIEQRRAVVQNCGDSTKTFITNIIEWLRAIEKSQRARLKIDKYLLNDVMVGINCRVIHRYKNMTHCDDYLTWHDPDKSSGLGIVSAIRNFTDPDMKGYRYNLGTPCDINGSTLLGHGYKWDIIPECIRLTQSVIISMNDGNDGAESEEE